MTKTPPRTEGYDALGRMKILACSLRSREITLRSFALRVLAAHFPFLRSRHIFAGSAPQSRALEQDGGAIGTPLERVLSVDEYSPSRA